MFNFHGINIVQFAFGLICFVIAFILIIVKRRKK